MKTNNCVECRVSSAEKAGADGHSRHPSPVTRHSWAFTLIELLVVIAIVATLAALLLPVAGAVKRREFIHATQAQMAQLETAIERYKAAYGFYPPGSTKTIYTNNFPISQLYYELVGTTNVAAPTADPIYQSLADPNVQISGGSPPGGDVFKVFGVAGFMNCSKANTDESAPRGQDFLPDLRPNQIAENVTNQDGIYFTLLVASAGGPDASYRPVGLQDVNPWRYNSSNPTHNPGSYDLYVQLQIGGKKYLVCNWSKQVQRNSPLP